MRRAVALGAVVGMAAFVPAAQGALDGPAIRPAEAETTYLVVRPNSFRRGVVLRARPDGPVVARVGAWTRFGNRPRLSVVREEGRWLAVSSPELPNETVGWVPREKVRISLTNVSLVADLSSRSLAVRVGRRVVRRVRVAIGSPSTPTPPGRYAVTDKFSGSIYGRYFGCCVIALSGHQPKLPPGWTGGDLLGVHGTDAPWAIGTASSAGCLRARDADMRFLMRTVPVGAPVFIKA